MKTKRKIKTKKTNKQTNKRNENLTLLLTPTAGENAPIATSLLRPTISRSLATTWQREAPRDLNRYTTTTIKERTKRSKVEKNVDSKLGTHKAAKKLEQRSEEERDHQQEGERVCMWMIEEKERRRESEKQSKTKERKRNKKKRKTHKKTTRRKTNKVSLAQKSKETTS